MSKIESTKGRGEDSGQGLRLDRRHLLAAGVASLGVGAALFAGPEPAGAANGKPVELGESNSASDTTTITNSAAGAFAGNTSANGGHAGVHGNDTSSKGGYGVAGNSVNGDGVIGTTAGNAQAGVYGNDGSPDGAYGVRGDSRVGVGVYGYGSSGAYGVQGDSTISVGVYGSSESGTGVVATSPDGYAFQAVGVSQFVGPVQFKQSGIAKVDATKSSVTVRKVGLTKSSLVLATLQGAQVAGVWVQSVTQDVSAGSFKIILSAAVPSGESVKIGWFVVN